jgi:hypothetical protein
MANEKLGNARKAKNDEFYTQYHDIENEMNAYLEFDADVFRDKVVLLPCDDPEWSNFTKYFAQNFERFGLKKLISTSFAPDSKPLELNVQPTLFEMDSPKFDTSKATQNGKIFTLTRDTTGDNVINVDDLEWEYLEGTGDFRSDEVTQLREEADIIVTNPPFSLFREFLSWINEAEKQFVIIGNINCITYKEVFPLIMSNQIWLGNGIGRWISGFIVPESYELFGTEARIEGGQRIVATNNALWLTNLDHGRRHQPIPLMTMEDNIKFSKHRQIKDFGYQQYDNYQAIEVPFTDAIPSDYDGVMGVPITFLSKYNPDQFEILDPNDYRKSHQKPKNYALIKDADGSVNGVNKYVRLVIRHRKSSK